MRRFRFAATSWLALLSLGAIAQAQTFNVASDWANTYPTTTALNAATIATWGPGTGDNVWAAGEMSLNWTNYNSQVNTLSTYYSATPTVASTSAATYTYTVPFQTYQLDPGHKISQQIGAVAGNILASGLKTAQGSTIGLHNQTASATTTSGFLNETGGIESIEARTGSSFTAYATGFTTTAFSTSTQINDGASGNNTTLAEVPGVFYNYSTIDRTSGGGSGVATENVPSGPNDNMVLLNNSIGPTYVSWTAPSAGTITSINVAAYEMRESSGDNDEGFSSFYVATSAAASVNGFSSYLLAATHGNLPLGQTGAANASLSSTVGTAAYATSAPAGYTIYNNASGVTWSASNIVVTAGEVLYFIGDPTHGDAPSGASQNHTWPGSSDPIALQASIQFVPEPSSFVLLGMASVGLAAVARRRRRQA
jgi:hypothetical protein